MKKVKLTNNNPRKCWVESEELESGDSTELKLPEDRIKEIKSISWLSVEEVKGKSKSKSTKSKKSKSSSSKKSSSKSSDKKSKKKSKKKSEK